MVVHRKVLGCAKIKQKHTRKMTQATCFLGNVPLRFFLLFSGVLMLDGVKVAKLYSVLSDTVSSKRVCVSGRERERACVSVTARLFF